jgi:hypothetical protein
MFHAWKAYALTEKELPKLWGKGMYTFHCKKSILSITYSLNPISPLPCPEHHIRTPGETRSGNANIARYFFPFLKLDIISRDNMGKQRLNFVDRKESSGAESKS